MKLRHLALIVLFVGGFWFVISHLPQGSLSRLPFVGSPHATEPLQLVEAATAPVCDTQEQTGIDIYRRVLPSVVNITSTSLVFDFFYGVVPQQGQGSGFVLDKAGHILTNYHVVQDANRGVQVTLSDKAHYPATVLNIDKTHDLALLKIDAPNLQPVTLADSSKLQVGQRVFAIGNPFGLSGTMTQGIISSIRSIRNANGALIDNAIQTDAAINPGNSGGPLLNSAGQVIGINTMILSNNGADQNAGIGFAIPINTAKAVLADFSRYGRVRRPSLGIDDFAIGPDLAQQMGLAADSGVLVQHVVPGGAAQRAGIRGGNQEAYLGNTPIMLGGDLIVAIDGHQVTDPQDITDIMDQHEVGDTVTVTFYRGRRKMTAKLTLGEAKNTNS
ncbi:MAG TPA: trypsin-like peptidase domain-containing protein [Terracidiphilus sp.]|nr:trypsin-like peptidase domain-containing protein [Terracidiphilus sp.]